MGYLGILLFCLLYLCFPVDAENFCNLTNPFVIKSDCASCQETLKGGFCPNGTVQITQGQGVDDCYHKSMVSENVSLKYKGCRHLCKGKTVIPDCCPGYYGPDCLDCPGGSQTPCRVNGICMDGLFGNGSCVCNASFSGFACENCRDQNKFGEFCENHCRCEHGACSSGVSGDGTCSCERGYQGQHCETRSVCVNAKADIAFIINLVQTPDNLNPPNDGDSSGDIEPDHPAPKANTQQVIREFLTHFVSEFNNNADRVQFGFYFGDLAVNPGSLELRSKDNVVDFIRNNDFLLPASADVAGRLSAVKDVLVKLQSTEGRTDAVQAVILLTTDVAEWNFDEAAKIAEAMTIGSVNLYSIAVSNNSVVRFVMDQITPAKDALIVSSLDGPTMKSSFDQILVDICNKSAIPAIPTCGSFNCQLYSHCIESENGPKCECNLGYKATESGCQYIDSCLATPKPCAETATCWSVGPGEHNCTCKDGYKGDGQVCAPVNHCEQDNGGCPPDTSDCVYDGPGQSSCVCIDGYEDLSMDDGCTLIDICLTNASICSDKANCTTTGPNEYKCVCKVGYGGDGKHCYGNLMEKVGELNDESNATFRGHLFHFLRLMRNTYADALTEHGPFTLFVSVDRGFSAALSPPQIANVINNREYGRQMLRMHMLVGEFPMESLRNASSFYTLQGAEAELNCKSGCDSPQHELVYKLNGHYDHAAVLKGNIKASNGFIHVISRLLDKPPNVVGSSKKSVWDILTGDGQFEKFRALAEMANIASILGNSMGITVFAPNDEAFDVMPHGTFEYLLSEQGKGRLLTVLGGHIILNKSIGVASLINMERILTYGNQFIEISVSEVGQIRLNGKVNISQADIEGSNGYLYQVDALVTSQQMSSILPHRCDSSRAKNVTGPCVICHLVAKCPMPTDTPTERKVSCHSLGVTIPRFNDRRIFNMRDLFCRQICQREIKVPRCCAGFYGAACYPCPGGHINQCFGRGDCNDGMSGNGSCTCHEAYTGAACEFCAANNKYGENCTSACQCLHGTCNNRMESDGECVPNTCAPGFTGRNCDTQVKKCAKRLRCHAFAQCVRPDIRILFNNPSFVKASRRKKKKLLRRLSKRGKCQCLQGYRGSGMQCEEIDPCQEVNRGGCHQQAACARLGPGRNRCDCISGWVGDGTYCYPSTPCMNHTHCHPHAQCQPSVVGQYVCICKENYHGNGTSCVANNVCLTDNGGCHKLASCSPTGPGLANCTCPRGFGGDGLSCFGTIAQEIKSHPLLSRLSQLSQVIPEGENFLGGNNTGYTLFAPTDPALEKFMKTAEFDFWKDEDNILVLLSYHTLPLALTESDLRNNTGDDLFTLVARGRVSINITSISQTLYINQAQVVAGDQPALNGVVHIIDGVLEPYPVRAQQPGLGEVLSRMPEYHNFLQVINETGFLADVEHLEAYTVFVPTDPSWKGFTLSKAANKRYLSYYVIPEEMPLWRLLEQQAQNISSLLGSHLQGQLSLTSKQGQLFVNSIPVTFTDMWTDGGVVHGIMGLLNPVLERCDTRVEDTTWTLCGECNKDAKPKCSQGFRLSTPITYESNCSYIPADSVVKRNTGCRFRCVKSSLAKDCCSGYFGPTCARCPGAIDSPCSGHGVCGDGMTGRGTCFCRHGYVGAACNSCSLGVCEVDSCGINPGGCLPPTTCQTLSGVEWQKHQGTTACVCNRDEGCSITDVLVKMKGIDIFKDMFLNSNLSVHLDDEGNEKASSLQAITVFVPLDGGFTRPIKEDDAGYKNAIVFDHTVEEDVLLGRYLLSQASYTTISSKWLHISKFYRNATVNETYRVNDVAVVSGNIICTNGVIHLIASPLDHNKPQIAGIKGAKHVSSSVLTPVIVVLVIASLGIVLLVVHKKRQSMSLSCTKEGSMQFSTLSSSHSDDTEPLDSASGGHERTENFLSVIFDNPAMDDDLTDCQQLINN